MTRMLARSAAPLVLAIAAALTVACERHVPPPVLRKPTSLIVLLPDDDSSQAALVTVSNTSGSVELNVPYQSTRIGANLPPSSPAAMDRADADREFRDVLGSLPPRPVHFTLYFEFATDELTAESRAQVPEILQVVRGRPPADVIVVGHTDTMGTTESNYVLGLQRAMIARDLLIGAGLDPSAMEITSHGEGDLLVPTADQVFEPRNRRVEIDIQ